ncbi:MAG: phospholipase D family protein [Bacteroidetes bacterium]|nr:phospholipase D family protein [Bacteroidota bacterium]
MINKLKKYYSKAIRTTLLAQDKLSKNWHHIFSVIELQTEDEYPYYIPNQEWVNNCVRAQQSKLENYSFYLSIDEISSVGNAINVFNKPFEDFTIAGEKISFFNTAFVKEPSGDYPLVFAPNFYSDEGISSILPKRKSGLLVWSQIDFERTTKNKFVSKTDVSKEMLAIQKLTMDWLGFDIIQKNEHIGNIYLSAPNPYFREIEVSLSTSPTGIFYKILNRKKEFEPLIFRIVDKHGDTIALDKTYEIKDNVGLIELPHKPHLFELRIYNQENELIAIHEPASFLESIQFGISIKQADFHVKVETEKVKKNFVVEKFSKEQTNVIGKQREFNPEYYFKDAEEKRKYIELEKKKEFIFYSGAKNETEKSKLKEQAKSVIREILNKAKDTCYICDPYFADMDIIDFAFQIRNSGVEINILNSKEFILKDKAKNIAKVVESYNSKPFSNIVVRTLRGNSILHDRFIITDKNVWFVGSSFNEFGSRATCIAKVPESSGTIIVKEVEKWFHSEKYSQNIVDYAKEVNNE